jgi:hypothetical protein
MRNLRKSKAKAKASASNNKGHFQFLSMEFFGNIASQILLIASSIANSSPAGTGAE